MFFVNVIDYTLLLETYHNSQWWETTYELIRREIRRKESILGDRTLTNPLKVLVDAEGRERWLRLPDSFLYL